MCFLEYLIILSAPLCLCQVVVFFTFVLALSSVLLVFFSPVYWVLFGFWSFACAFWIWLPSRTDCWFWPLPASTPCKPCVFCTVFCISPLCTSSASVSASVSYPSLRNHDKHAQSPMLRVAGSQSLCFSILLFLCCSHLQGPCCNNLLNQCRSPRSRCCSNPLLLSCSCPQSQSCWSSLSLLLLSYSWLLFLGCSHLLSLNYSCY